MSTSVVIGLFASLAGHVHSAFYGIAIDAGNDRALRRVRNEWWRRVGCRSVVALEGCRIVQGERSSHRRLICDRAAGRTTDTTVTKRVEFVHSLVDGEDLLAAACTFGVCDCWLDHLVEHDVVLRIQCVQKFLCSEVSGMRHVSGDGSRLRMT